MFLSSIDGILAVRTFELDANCEMQRLPCDDFWIGSEPQNVIQRNYCRLLQPEQNSGIVKVDSQFHLCNLL